LILRLILPFLLFASVGAAVPLQAPTSAAGDKPSIRYRFENDRFLISRIELSVDGSGSGLLEWEEKGSPKPRSRAVRVSEEGLAELSNLLDRLNFLHSGEEYQSAEDHGNLGSTAIRVSQGEVSREVVFNYTRNKDADALARLLRGIANREMFVADLEVAMQHQPLETPAALATLAQEHARGRIGDAVALLPLLRSIADDMSLPLIARNRASDLAKAITKRR